MRSKARSYTFFWDDIELKSPSVGPEALGFDDVPIETSNFPSEVRLGVMLCRLWRNREI